MSIYISIVIGFSMLWTPRVSASPYAKLQAVSQIPPPANVSLPVFEAPAASNLSSPPYVCFSPGETRSPITVDDCRDTLRIVRNLDDYGRVQEFQRNKKPLMRVEGARGFRAPPFLFNANEGLCGLEITDNFHGVIDKFSFRQVRELAQDIVEECNAPGKPGYGGQWTIGEKRYWTIRIFGIKDDLGDPLTNITSVTEVVGNNIALITNATTAPGPSDDASFNITTPISSPARGQTS